MKSYKEIMTALKDNGFDSWVVGGAVRDTVLSKAPKDYDIATTAVPEQVMSIFADSKLINAAFSVAVYVPTENGYTEVVTLRREKDYKNGRPQSYEFVGDIRIDLARRDATINAMAMDYDGNVIDPFGGKDDIGAQVIRAVGNPTTRILEHPIRMLRYIRFATSLSFGIDDKLEDAIIANAKYIGKEKWEAISAEFLKGLDHKGAAMYLYMLQRYGILEVIIPEISKTKGLVQNRYHDHDVWMHTLFAVASARREAAIEKFAILLHDVGKPDTAEYLGKDYGNSFHGHESVGAKMSSDICHRFRLPKYETRLIHDAIKWHMYPIKTARSARRFVSKFTWGDQSREAISERVEFALTVRRADKFAHKKSFVDSGAKSEESLVRSVLSERQPFSISDLDVNGNDVMNELGISQGKKVGEILSHLLDLVVSDRTKNTKEDLLSEARAYYGKSIA